MCSSDVLKVPWQRKDALGPNGAYYKVLQVIEEDGLLSVRYSNWTDLDYVSGTIIKISPIKRVPLEEFADNFVCDYREARVNGARIKRTEVSSVQRMNAHLESLCRTKYKPLADRATLSIDALSEGYTEDDLKTYNQILRQEVTYYLNITRRDQKTYFPADQELIKHIQLVTNMLTEYKVS